MNPIEKISGLLDTFLTATILVGAVFGLLAYYFIKVKKIASKEERIDYSAFYRRDSLDYVKFDDITSEGESDAINGAGVIVLEDGKTFVAGLNISGYPFGSAAAEERQATMIHSVSVFNLVEQGIQLRQSVTSVELTHNIEDAKQIIKNLTIELLDLNAAYERALEEAEDHIDDMEPEQSEMYLEQVKDLKRQIDAKTWMISEEQAQIDYMNQITMGEKDSQKVNQFMFSYEFNPNDFTEEQTKSAIYLRAMTELNNKGNAYKAALERCGYSCQRLTSGELTDLMRKHCHPLTAEDVRLDELFHSSYNSLYITSDSLLELEKERLTEAAYQELVSNYYNNNQQEVDTLMLEAQRNERIMMESIADELKEQEFDPYIELNM